MDLLLFREWRATPPGPKADRIRNRLVMDNLGIVHQLVRNLANGPDYEDMAQAGTIGLMIALDKFKPELGAFISYAKPWVLYEIQKEIRKKKGTTKSTKSYTVEDVALSLNSEWRGQAWAKSVDDDQATESLGLPIVVVDGKHEVMDARRDLEFLTQDLEPVEVAALLAQADGAGSEDLATILGLTERSRASRERARTRTAYALARCQEAARGLEEGPRAPEPPAPSVTWPAPVASLPCWSCICRTCSDHAA